MSVATVLFFVLTALGALAQTASPRVDNPTNLAYSAVYPTYSNAPYLHIFARISHTPVVDSLAPVHSSESVTPSNHKQLTTAAVLTVFVFVGVCAIIAVVFFLVRYFMRRAAIKRRRQASWILRSGHWNMEPKRRYAHETRTGCSDTSSSFSAYPYPLSEHY